MYKNLVVALVLAVAGCAHAPVTVAPAPVEVAPPPPAAAPCVLVEPPNLLQHPLIMMAEPEQVTDGEGVDHEVTFGAVDTDSLKQVIAKQAALVVWSRYVWEKCGLGGGK